MAFDFSGSFPGSHWGQPLANPRAPSVAPVRARWPCIRSSVGGGACASDPGSGNSGFITAVKIASRGGSPLRSGCDLCLSQHSRRKVASSTDDDPPADAACVVTPVPGAQGGPLPVRLRVPRSRSGITRPVFMPTVDLVVLSKAWSVCLMRPVGTLSSWVGAEEPW